MSVNSSSQDQCFRLAYTILADWEKEQNLDLLIDRLRRENFDTTLINRTFTLLRQLFRKKASLEFCISKLCPKKPKERLYRVLLIALTQKFYQDGLADALVSDCAVRFTKERFKQQEANFINACLRRADISLLTENKIPLEIELNLSPAIFKAWKPQFKVKTLRRIANILAQPAPLICRSLKGRNPDLTGLEPVTLPPWADNYTFYEISKPGEFFASDRLKDFYIQDPATVSSIELLSPQEGETVADLCAAPGGKSLLIAERIGTTGKLYSCDVSEKRMENLRKNLDHLPQVDILQQDATNPIIDEKSLDAVIIDVPCSNSGVIRRKADVRWTFSEKKVKELNTIQMSILMAAAKLVKDDGRIVYSTCSIERLENCDLVRQFLENMSDFELIEERQILPANYHDGSYSALIRKKA